MVEDMVPQTAKFYAMGAMWKRLCVKTFLGRAKSD